MKSFGLANVIMYKLTDANTPFVGIGIHIDSFKGLLLCIVGHCRIGKTRFSSLRSHVSSFMAFMCFSVFASSKHESISSL